MYGGPATEEQKKIQEKYAYDTLKVSGLIAGALWITPIVYHYIKRQF